MRDDDTAEDALSGWDKLMGEELMMKVRVKRPKNPFSFVQDSRSRWGISADPMHLFLRGMPTIRATAGCGDD